MKCLNHSCRFLQSLAQHRQKEGFFYGGPSPEARCRTGSTGSIEQGIESPDLNLAPEPRSPFHSSLTLDPTQAQKQPPSSLLCAFIAEPRHPSPSCTAVTLPSEGSSDSASATPPNSSGSLSNLADLELLPQGRKGNTSRMLITHSTINQFTNTTTLGKQGFAILASNATISATADAHHRWQIPTLSPGSPDSITLESILGQAQGPDMKRSAIMWIHCPDPARAATISRLVAHRLRNTHILPVTYFVEAAYHSCDTTQIIPTLAYQICKGLPEVQVHLPCEDQGVYGSVAEVQLNELVINPLNGVHGLHSGSTRKAILIVIDGLDQVDLRWAVYLLRLFAKQILRGNLPSVRILVTSQYHRRFETLLTGPEVCAMTSVIALDSIKSSHVV
ncbi:hypothetical protein BJ165DRAFT_1401003 [Panaeolus papilionaceus]|nr:hypothetical protein BJ165DRAFT_1401003 [Panaeolus papilionaceus]